LPSNSSSKRRADALRFLAVEDRFGLDVAVELNEKIRKDMGGRSARGIKKRLKKIRV